MDVGGSEGKINGCRFKSGCIPKFWIPEVSEGQMAALGRK